MSRLKLPRSICIICLFRRARDESVKARHNPLKRARARAASSSWKNYQWNGSLKRPGRVGTRRQIIFPYRSALRYPFCVLIVINSTQVYRYIYEYICWYICPDFDCSVDYLTRIPAVWCLPPKLILPPLLSTYTCVTSGNCTQHVNTENQCFIISRCGIARWKPLRRRFRRCRLVDLSPSVRAAIVIPAEISWESTLLNPDKTHSWQCVSSRNRHKMETPFPPVSSLVKWGSHQVSRENNAGRRAAFYGKIIN